MAAMHAGLSHSLLHAVRVVPHADAPSARLHTGPLLGTLAPLQARLVTSTGAAATTDLAREPA